ncbi:unnamed protein product [Durusdinium trenchii]|uniref:Uncharacterized protein n=1 Tax=Durusdinium trenchii TaxID=1381693 RepID=A0ABP0K2Y2_9DINO
MPLFQPEGPEKQRRPKRKEPPSAVLDRSDEGDGALSRPGSLFQAEPEEGLQVVKSKPSGSKKQLFDPESESSDGECSRDSDALEDTLSSAALNFGWHKLHEAAKARFAKEVSAAGKQEKPKRHYDNSKRAARAAYERTAGKFKENGLSSERITGVRAALQPLPWHSADSQAPGVGDPVYRLHPSVVASLAPSVPLRAAFGGARHV